MFDYGADASDAGLRPGRPRRVGAGASDGGDRLPACRCWRPSGRCAPTTPSFERAYLNVWPRPSEALAAAGLDLDAWRSRGPPGPGPGPGDRARPSTSPPTAAQRRARRRRPARRRPAPPGRRGRVDRPGRRPRRRRQDAARRRTAGCPSSPTRLVAASVVAELRRARVVVDPIGAGDHARACGHFVDRLTAATLTHRAQAVLDDAIIGAARRPLGDAWLWSRRHSAVDISPLVAVTLAAWAAATRRGGGRGAVVRPAGAPGPERPHPTYHPTPVRRLTAAYSARSGNRFGSGLAQHRVIAPQMGRHGHRPQVRRRRPVRRPERTEPARSPRPAPRRRPPRPATPSARPATGHHRRRLDRLDPVGRRLDWLLYGAPPRSASPTLPGGVQAAAGRVELARRASSSAANTPYGFGPPLAGFEPPFPFDQAPGWFDRSAAMSVAADLPVPGPDLLGGVGSCRSRCGPSTAPRCRTSNAGCRSTRGWNAPTRTGPANGCWRGRPTT